MSWGDVEKVINENDKHYVLYDDNNKYLLQNVEFNERLLMKELVSFKEFELIEKFYSKLMDNDNKFILNNNKIIKFNII